VCCVMAGNKEIENEFARRKIDRKLTHLKT
jgi:hypothetical protein